MVLVVSLGREYDVFRQFAAVRVQLSRNDADFETPPSNLIIDGE